MGSCRVCGNTSVSITSDYRLPLLLRSKNEVIKKGRKNRRRQRIKELILNQRILGLNILWKGWNWAEKGTTWIHFECAERDLQFLFRRMLRWQSKYLTVPMCMSDFKAVMSKENSPYNENGIHRISVAEVKVESISLPTEAPVIVPLLSILPEEISSKYQLEERILSQDKEDWEKMKKFKVRLGMSVKEYKKIIGRLLALKMVKLLPLQQVKVINGLQCVTKADGRQRLIFDGRPVNFIFSDPEKVTLPDFSLLSGWQVSKEEVVRFGKLDLENFYHHLGVPEWMSPYLALPSIEAEDLGLKGGSVCPVCLTLPMGLAHAVLLAQQAHLFLFQHSLLSPDINIQVLPSASMWVLIYIDDLIIGVKDGTVSRAESRVNHILQLCLEIYKNNNLVVNREKIVLASPDITGLGCSLSAEKRGIGPKAEKAKLIVGATRYLLSQSMVTTKQVESLLGHWVWFFLLSRPLYSIFFYVYRWLKRDGSATSRILWESVRREFKLAILFLDRCHLSWGRSSANCLIATDASTKGAGACIRNVQVASVMEIFGGELKKCLMEGVAWVPTLNKKWDFEEHINILEFRALLLALRPWLKDTHKVHKKWQLLLDSQVVMGIIRKGRSSSYMLGCLMRRLLSICLYMNVSLSILWVPSALNPADVLSRVFPPEGRHLPDVNSASNTGTLEFDS